MVRDVRDGAPMISEFGEGPMPNRSLNINEH
jgi:hypothetical protein